MARGSMGKQKKTLYQKMEIKRRENTQLNSFVVWYSVTVLLRGGKEHGDVGFAGITVFNKQTKGEHRAGRRHT